MIDRSPVLIRACAGIPGRAAAAGGGVRVGLNVPYSLGLGNNLAAEEVLTHLVDLKVGSVELRAQPGTRRVLSRCGAGQAIHPAAVMALAERRLGQCRREPAARA